MTTPPVTPLRDQYDGRDWSPPHDSDAEAAVLGAVLAAPNTFGELAAQLQPSDFYRPAHETLWRVFLRMQEAGRPLDPVTVLGELRAAGITQPSGDELHTLLAAALPANATYHAGIVLQHSRARQVVALGQRLTQLGHASNGNLDTALLTAMDEVETLLRSELFGGTSPASTLAPLTRLDAFLAIPDEDVTYRVDRIWPAGGRVILAAQHKAGKTTIVGNLLRSLADGEPFLDAYAVQQVKRVILVDNELDERMLRRWLRDHGVHDQHRIEILTLRGRLSTFNILDPGIRAQWARHIGAADVLILDCLRPALDALGLSEDKDAGRFLEALDELTTAAGIPESLTVHHMGHSNERSRGDSRILDWPDALWKLVKDAENDDTPPGAVARYFSAYGRDVDVPQSLIGFDPVTRHQHIAGGSRTDRVADAALPDVIELLAQNPGLSGRSIEDELQENTDHTQKAVRAALKRGVRDGLIAWTHGPRGAHLHTLTDSSAPARLTALPVRQPGQRECVSASIETHTHTQTNSPALPLGEATHSDEAGTG